MARPTKAFNERRDDQLTIRVTAAERARIEQAADMAGLTSTEYLRRRALGVRMTVARRRSEPERLAAVALIGIGNNLNQMTKHANAGYGLPVRGALEELLIRVHATLDGLYDPSDQHRRPDL